MHVWLQNRNKGTKRFRHKPQKHWELLIMLLIDIIRTIIVENKEIDRVNIIINLCTVSYLRLSTDPAWKLSGFTTMWVLTSCVFISIFVSFSTSAEGQIPTVDVLSLKTEKGKKDCQLCSLTSFGFSYVIVCYPLEVLSDRTEARIKNLLSQP